MKVYTIIGGVNGAGKSSLTGVLISREANLGTIIDVDKLTAEKFGGDEYEGGKAAIAQIEECLQSGSSFTQETTLSGSYTRKVAAAAKAAGYYIRMFYVGIDTIEESIKRIKNRVELGGHDIPADDVKRRFERRFSSLWQVLPLCDEAVFFDNRNGFVQVAVYTGSKVQVFAVKQPVWLAEMLEGGAP